MTPRPFQASAFPPCLFFHSRRMPLVTDHHIHFATFHLSRQARFWLVTDDSVPKLFAHPLGVVRVQPQLLGNLGIG